MATEQIRATWASSYGHILKPSVLRWEQKCQHALRQSTTSCQRTQLLGSELSLKDSPSVKHVHDLRMSSGQPFSIPLMHSLMTHLMKSVLNGCSGMLTCKFATWVTSL